MDVDLPVWTIRPNWAQGITERLEWLTDVLSSETGVEQRRSIRLSPRRSFEITVNPTGEDRTYLDLLLHRLGSEKWLFPLWHDQARLANPAVAGSSALNFDNTFREFQDGGYAILHFNTFDWEVVQIAAQTTAGVTLTEPLANTWSARTKLFPLREGYLPDATSLKALTDRVGESVLLFTVTGPNDYPEMSGDAMLEYAGSPLLALAPDRSTEITTDHTRLSDSLDGDIGVLYRQDDVGRAFAVQSHNWQVRGREAQAGFRSFLYTLRGRQRMVWLPTFNDDVTLAVNAAAGQSAATIRSVGMRYVGSGSPIPGRAMLWTGQEVALIGTIPPPLTAGQERLGLLAPLTANYPAGRSWSFLAPCRLNQDSIEIHHNADSEGVFEVSAGFQSFNNARDASGSNFVPIPITPKDVTPCGAPLGLNPCRSGQGIMLNLDAQQAGTPVTITGYTTNAVLRVSLPANQMYSAYLRYFVITDEWSTQFIVTPNMGGGYNVGKRDFYPNADVARADFAPFTMTGATEYTFVIPDNVPYDNVGGLSIKVEVIAFED